MTYHEQLKHPEWQKKRLQIMEMHDFECSDCGSTDKQLHVHHTYYDKRLKLWEYEDRFLICLCSECHKNAHDFMQSFNKMMAELGFDELSQVYGYAFALSDPCAGIDTKYLNHEVLVGASDYWRLPLEAIEFLNNHHDFDQLSMMDMHANFFPSVKRSLYHHKLLKFHPIPDYSFEEHF